MVEYQIKIVESIVLLIFLIGTVKLMHRLISKVGEKFSYNSTRIVILKKLISIISYVTSLGTILLIWGIAPSQLVAYIASLFTVVGIAFIAQWSIISNITSTLIIYFNHQVHIGDSIQILDKDFQVEGIIHDIGIFFIIIKVSQNEFVSLPSNLFMQKMVKKIYVG